MADATKTPSVAREAADKQQERELLFNERTFEHPTLGRLTLRRPTPEEDFLIAEYRTERWNEDMASGKYRFRDELIREYERRGIWQPEMAAKVDELSRRLGEAMGLLDSLGFTNFEGLVKAYTTDVQKLTDVFPEDAEWALLVQRVYNVDTQSTLEDRLALNERLPEAAIAIREEVDQMRAQIQQLKDLQDVRKELGELQAKQVRLFLGSIESRADRAEEMGRIFYCTYKAGTNERYFSAIQDLWRMSAEAVEAQVLQMSYFLNGVTKEFEETLGRYGFTRRLVDTSDSSVDSPDQPPSSSAGDSPESAPTSSSASTASAATSSTPSSSDSSSTG